MNYQGDAVGEPDQTSSNWTDAYRITLSFPHDQRSWLRRIRSKFSFSSRSRSCGNCGEVWDRPKDRALRLPNLVENLWIETGVLHKPDGKPIFSTVFQENLSVRLQFFHMKQDFFHSSVNQIIHISLPSPAE
jgi:hypothetical protein